MKKNKDNISTCLERHMASSNCYTCAFGYPLCNPRMCLFGLRDDYYENEDKAISPNPKCDRYIHKDRFQHHLNGMLGIDDDLINSINMAYSLTTTVTVKIPKDCVSDVIDVLRKKHHTINTIRNAFGLSNMEVTNEK